MKKRAISFLLCGIMVLSLVSPMNALAVDNIDAVMVESESETTEEIATVLETVLETEFFTEDNVSEMETESITESVTEKLVILESKTELETETETSLVTVQETNAEMVKEDNAIRIVAEAKVGDKFKTYFGEFEILTVGENPTVAIIGGEQMDYDGNFWYGDPSKAWTAKYLDVTYAVTTISCHISGNIVNIPEGIEYIDNQVFKFNSTKNLILPSTLKHFDEDQALPYLESITVAEGNPYYKSVDNVLFTADGKKLLLYPAKDTREYYSTPEGTEEIIHGAFYKNFKYGVDQSKVDKSMEIWLDGIGG